MRDIRPDLRERLEAEEAAAKQVAAILDAYHIRIEAIREMIAVEDARFAAEEQARKMGGTVMGGAPPAAEQPAPTSVPPRSAVEKLDMDEFLFRAIQRGVSDKDDLRDAAVRAGYFEGSPQAPGRVVHAKLVNLAREGRIVKTEDGYAAKAA